MKSPTFWFSQFSTKKVPLIKLYSGWSADLVPHPRKKKKNTAGKKFEIISWLQTVKESNICIFTNVWQPCCSPCTNQSIAWSQQQSHGSFSWGCQRRRLVRLVFRPECTGQGLSPKPCTHMQLPFPPLQGTNQRSVHVKTDGSQIRFFWGFLAEHSPLNLFFFFLTCVIFSLQLASFEHVPHSYLSPFISTCCQSRRFLWKLQLSLHALDSSSLPLAPFSS